MQTMSDTFSVVRWVQPTPTLGQTLWELETGNGNWFQGAEATLRAGNEPGFWFSFPVDGSSWKIHPNFPASGCSWKRAMAPLSPSAETALP